MELGQPSPDTWKFTGSEEEMELAKISFLFWAEILGIAMLQMMVL